MVMKKIFITVIIVLMTCINAFAKNAPMYKNSINVAGIGVIKLPQEFTIYESDNERSPVIKIIKWGKAEGAYISDDYSDNFIIFDPLQNTAFMTVVEDSDNTGWYKICYDQKNELTGWVSPGDYTFYSWLSFFTKYGKMNGLYAFSDIDNTEKRLYSKPDFNSQIINTFENAKDIRIQIFRGNWALVRVYDYKGGMKIGWINWRTQEGKFKFFPAVLK